MSEHIRQKSDIDTLQEALSQHSISLDAVERYIQSEFLDHTIVPTQVSKIIQAMVYARGAHDTARILRGVLEGA